MSARAAVMRLIVGPALLMAALAGHAQMDMDGMQGGAPPADARDPHAYSDGVEFTRGAARPTLADGMRIGSILLDNLELTRIDGETLLPYDLKAWFGQTYRRIVLKSEGEFDKGDIAEARTELLFSQAFAAYWDLQAGVRYDSGEGPNRSWLAAGVEGLAPYWFDLDVTAYVGEAGRTAMRVDASYEMLLSQQLILEPSFEANLYGRDDPERALGSGLSDSVLALRLRYEIRRELAPYVGIERIVSHGGTRDLRRAAGVDTSDTRVVLGLRAWF